VSAVYVDTSVLGRVLLEEPDKPAIEDALLAFEHRVSCGLLRIELRRLGLRTDRLDQANSLLTKISLVPLDRRLLGAAETIAPPTVATLDAIHLAAAVRLHDGRELDALMTYDKRLADGARAHGIEVLSPS
jgi:predicted nucleic acid-binding protein